MIQCRLAICARGDVARGAKFGGGAGCGVPGASGRLAARPRCPSNVEAVLACPPNVRISGQLKLIMAPDPGAERHETGLSVRWDDMKVGFHGVSRGRDAGGGGTDGSWGN